MGVIYAAALRTARMTAVKDAIDAGSGAGTIEIGTAAMASVLAILTLSDPCGSVSGDVLTLSAITQDSSADNSGTAAAARIKDSSGNIIVSGLTCGTSGADIILSSTSITAGQVVPMTSGILTHNSTGT
jgi:hypothetical protein